MQAIPAPSSQRHGLNAIEVIVVLAIVTILALLLLFSLPRQRESQRFAICQMNLKQFGQALAYYDQATRHLPMVPPLAPLGLPSGTSPHTALLELIGLPSFRELDDPRRLPGPTAGLTVSEHSVAGFLCPSDPQAIAGAFPAPISYRATTGATVTGHDGAFAPGRRRSIAEIEAADGASYTAAFSERLLGNLSNAAAPRNYAVIDRLLTEKDCQPTATANWRGDAGRSWFRADWPDTLYNHALRPDQAPSCVAQDQRAAAIGASSGHVNRVNVLLLDGSVQTVVPQIEAKVWQGMASTDDAPLIDEDELPSAPPRERSNSAPTIR